MPMRIKLKGGAGFQVNFPMCVAASIVNVVYRLLFSLFGSKLICMCNVWVQRGALRGRAI